VSPTQRPTRATRCRVVVVGRRETAVALPDTVVHADNLFDAVGEVSVAGAGQPVSAVVVPTAFVTGSTRPAAEAFHRIDPSVRLILLAGSTDEPAVRDGLSDGFDDVVTEPLTAAAVSAILDGGPLPGPAADAERVPPQPAGPPSEPVPSEPAAAAEPPAPAAPAETVVVPGLVDLIASLEPSGAPAGAPPSGPLGDTDLVEAIMAHPAGVRARALQLMVEQTSWSDLALTDEPPPGDAAASVAVRYGARDFGALSTSRADERQLRPWAAWLARWLALDRSYREFRTMAFQDELTGAWNRRFYEFFMKRIIRDAARKRRQLTLLVFDIDDFKHYNDEYGHEAGDEILRETVRLLESVIRTGDRVCRIGGDEFVVIFADPEGPRETGSRAPEAVEEIAGRFQEQVCLMKFPKLGLAAPRPLSISGGLATYPWDGTDPETLLRHADRLALQSKKKGKNVITFGPDAAR
jgi:diguanylate cyclase (GGDEF)-like protein